MKYLILAFRLVTLSFLSSLFYIGFFMHTTVNKVGNHLSDTTIHFIAFFSYTILFYMLLPKFKLKFPFVLSVFCFLSYYVEVIQRRFFYRTYSLEDFKYALVGTILGGFVLLLFIVSRYLLNLIFLESKSST